MEVQITRTENTPYAFTVEVTVGKKSAYISRDHSDGRINVLCRNASHACWRGVGRFFDSWELATEGYKSGGMKAAIETACEIMDDAAAKDAQDDPVKFRLNRRNDQ